MRHRLSSNWRVLHQVCLRHWKLLELGSAPLSFFRIIRRKELILHGSSRFLLGYSYKKWAFSYIVEAAKQLNMQPGTEIGDEKLKYQELYHKFSNGSFIYIIFNSCKENISISNQSQDFNMHWVLNIIEILWKNWSVVTFNFANTNRHLYWVVAEIF